MEKDLAVEGTWKDKDVHMKSCINEILTNIVRSRRNLGATNYQTCRLAEEVTLHVLKDCEYAKNVWLNFLKGKYRSIFFVMTLEEWVDNNLMKDFGHNVEEDWVMIWGNTIYFLWQWHNKRCFDANFKNPFHPNLIILNYIKDFYIASNFNGIIVILKEERMIDVCWNPLNDG